jgi:hypothetical protein
MNYVPKLGRYIAEHDIDLRHIAKRLHISLTAARRYAYETGTTRMIAAMAWAYALNCTPEDLLETKETGDALKWKDKK